MKKIQSFNEYQKLAQRTVNHELTPDMRLAVAGLGLVGEGGEVSELIKKKVGHGHPLSKEKIQGELGDVLWYVAEVAAIFDLTLEEVASHNIHKLEQRYSNKKFESHKSLYRKENDQI